jgi:hypothetical protein
MKRNKSVKISASLTLVQAIMPFPWGLF